MFSKQKYSSKSGSKLPATVSNNNDIPSIIASDLKIVGNLISGGVIEIEGEVEGNVTCGQVSIRKAGRIKGDVIADAIQVDGEVNGLVKGKFVNIAETGRVTGVVMYESLSIKDGACIDGQCKSSDRLHRGSVETMDSSSESDDEETEKEDNASDISLIDGDSNKTETTVKHAKHHNKEKKEKHKEEDLV